MSSSLNYRVDEKSEPMEISKYMTEVLEFSGRFARKALKEKRVKINGKVATSHKLVQSRAVIEVIVEKEESQNIEPQAMELDILYEDDDLVLINKPPFMLVHPTGNHPTGTLANGLLHHFKESGQSCIVRLVSRLDRDTSGLILVAKNTFAHMSLAKAMENQEIIKRYIAIVRGQMKPDQGTIDLPIKKSDEDTKRMRVSPDGLESITHYETIAIYQGASLLNLVLETGRTHQIRVHLSHLGCPIYGDHLYGAVEEDSINRQALHATGLTFPHPRTKAIMTFISEMPEDMKALLEKLK